LNSLTKYSKQFLESLPPDQLKIQLAQLEDVIRQKFSSGADFNTTMDAVLEELRYVGHTLYRLDYDSDIFRFREVWGTNYHDMGAHGLEIEFISPNNIKVTWVNSLKK